MTIQIYKSFGVLGHEYQPFYSESAPASDVFERISVEIPFPTWRNVMDEVGVTIDGVDYLLSQVLTNHGDRPALAWFDGRSRLHKILKVVADD